MLSAVRHAPQTLCVNYRKIHILVLNYVTRVFFYFPTMIRSCINAWSDHGNLSLLLFGKPRSCLTYIQCCFDEFQWFSHGFWWSPDNVFDDFLICSMMLFSMSNASQQCTLVQRAATFKTGPIFITRQNYTPAREYFKYMRDQHPPLWISRDQHPPPPVDLTNVV